MKVFFLLCGVLLASGCTDNERNPVLDGPNGIGGSTDNRDAAPNDDGTPGDGTSIAGKLCVVTSNLSLNSCPTQIGGQDIDFSQFKVSQRGTSQSFDLQDEDDSAFTLSVVGTGIVDLLVTSSNLDAQDKPSLISAKVGGTNQNAPILDPLERIELFNQIGIGETNGSATVVMYTDLLVEFDDATDVLYKNDSLWDAVGPSETGLVVAVGVVVIGERATVIFVDGDLRLPVEIPVAPDTTTFVVGP